MTEIAELLTWALCKKELDKEFSEDRKTSGEGGGDWEGCDHFEFGVGECEVVWREMVMGREKESEKEEEACCWNGDAGCNLGLDPIVEEVRYLNRGTREIQHVRKKVEKYLKQKAEKLAKEQAQAKEEETQRQIDAKTHNEDPERWDKEQQEKWQAWIKKLKKEQKEGVLPWFFYKEEREKQREYRREWEKGREDRRKHWERLGLYE